MSNIIPLHPQKEIITPPPLGVMLIERALITQDELRIALHEQRQNHALLGQILVRLGFLSETQLVHVLAERTGLAIIYLKNVMLDEGLLEKISNTTCLRLMAVPIKLESKKLTVAMADPYDLIAMDEVRRHFPNALETIVMLAIPSEIAEIVQRYSTSSFDTILKELENGFEDEEASREFEHPVIRLVNAILFDAVRRGASDIHLEPENTFVRLRFRMDGVMQQIHALHRTHWSELSHRIKIMSGLDIADTRNLQNGRFKLTLHGREVDFRISTMPTMHGENIVIRILDHKKSLMPLEKLGFNKNTLASLEKAIQKPAGIILVTGPTGCGKTTTLYSILQKIQNINTNIMTLEDPVEYQLPLIRQTAVNHHLGFAEGVRGILRQDPDIIFIGEIRDADTAQMAMRATMTGHKVFSTLHCHDALGALPRLMDLGLSARTIADNITAIIAQRLVRKLCPHCRLERPATHEECTLLGLQPIDVPMIYQASSCEHCAYTGYKGRTVVAEILTLSPALCEMIADQEGRHTLWQQAQKDHFLPIDLDGITKVLLGITSLDEVCRQVHIQGHD